MAAHDWELVRDRFLALYRGDTEEAEKIQGSIRALQLTCSHVPNPERPERCYKCGDESSAMPAAPLRKCHPDIERVRKAC
jgi:hypothetical protein